MINLLHNKSMLENYYLFQSAISLVFCIYRQTLKYLPSNWRQFLYFFTHIIVYIMFVHYCINFEQNIVIFTKLSNTAQIFQVISPFCVPIRIYHVESYHFLRNVYLICILLDSKITFWLNYLPIFLLTSSSNESQLTAIMSSQYPYSFIHDSVTYV